MFGNSTNMLMPNQNHLTNACTCIYIATLCLNDVYIWTRKTPFTVVNIERSRESLMNVLYNAKSHYVSLREVNKGKINTTLFRNRYLYDLSIWISIN